MGRALLIVLGLLALFAAAGRSGDLGLSLDEFQRQSHLDGDLAARLRALEKSAAAPGERLRDLSVLLLESGWQADSLSSSGGALRIHGARPSLQRIDKLDGSQPDSPWREGQVLADPQAVENEAAAWLANQDRLGFPFAQIWIRPSGDDRADTLALHVTLLPGPSGEVGETRIEGADRLGEGFLRKILDLDRGTPLSRHAAEQGRDRLAATGWFQEVAEPVLGWDPVDEAVGVLYRVRERPRPNRFAAALGGGTGPVNGVLLLDLFSPFGGGRRWQFSAEAQQERYQSIRVDLSEPRLFGQGIAMDLGFRRMLQDSTYLQQSIQMDLRLPFAAGWEGLAGFGYERTLFPLVQGEMSRRRQRVGLSWRSLGPGRPGENQLRVVGDLLIKNSELDDPGARGRQFELSGNLRWTQALVSPWKIRLRGGGSGLFSPGSRSGFNQAELFPLGGALTLRGYDEEHFRGDRVGYSSLELALGETLELSGFLDYGRGRWIQPDLKRVDFEGWGVGIGLVAPAERGQLSLYLAMGEEKRVESMRVHLALDAGF